MKTVLDGIFITVSLLLLCNFSFSIANDEPENLPQPPHPPTPNCHGFPGSAEWNQCWADFRKNMQKFQQQMLEYQEKLQAMNNETNTEGATSSIYSNGYKVRSRNLNVNSNSFNGQISIETFIGSPESLNVTTVDRTIKWDVVEDGRVDKWISLTPPEHVQTSSITYETKNQRLYILGPSDPNARGSSSSSSSFISSGGGSTFSNTFSSFF